ncbi:MAG: aminotransferase class IV [Pseudomonadota bacterium]
MFATMVERVIWFNGAFSNDEKCVSIRDRGFLLGDGAFETLLLRGGNPAFFDAHMSRLKKALKILRIETVPTEGWRSVVQQLWRRNDYSGGYGVARITVTRGLSGRGLSPVKTNPTVLITVEQVDLTEKSSYRLTIAKSVRFSGATANGFKSLSGYVENIIARHDAVEAGFDDAVLLNEHGRVACSTIANIYLIRGDGVIVTPPLTEGACPGVTRALVIELAGASGVEVHEQPVCVEALASNDVFLTNSLIGLQSARIDEFEEQKSSSLILGLQSAYAACMEKEFT